MNRNWNFRRGVLLALAGYTAFLVFAAPQRCADALQAGLRLCGGPLLVSLFPFLVVSALAAGCGAGQWLGFVFRPAARLMGIRAKGAGGVLLIGALGGFAPAAVAASEAVRTGQLTSRQASALLPACVCSGPSFVILTVGQQMLGSRAVGVRRIPGCAPLRKDDGSVLLPERYSRLPCGLTPSAPTLQAGFSRVHGLSPPCTSFSVLPAHSCAR